MLEARQPHTPIPPITQHYTLKLGDDMSCVPEDCHTRTTAHARPYIASGTKYVQTPNATGKGHHVHYPTSPQARAATHVCFAPTPNGLGVHVRFVYPDDNDCSSESSNGGANKDGKDIAACDRHGERSLPSLMYDEHPWCDWKRPPSPMSETSLLSVAEASSPPTLSLEERLATLSSQLLEYAVKKNIDTEKHPCHPNHVKNLVVRRRILALGESYHYYRDDEESSGLMDFEYNFHPDDQTVAPATRLLVLEAIKEGRKIRFGETYA